MSKYYGDYLAGSVIRMQTTSKSTSGAPSTLTSPTYVIMRDQTVVTPSGGVTFTPDSGSITGYITMIIDTSVDTATFTPGHDYAVRLTGGTVGGTSVIGDIPFEFSIQNRLDIWKIPVVNNAGLLYGVATAGGVLGATIQSPLLQEVGPNYVILQSNDDSATIPAIDQTIDIIGTIDSDKTYVNTILKITGFTSPNKHTFTPPSVWVTTPNTTPRFYYERRLPSNLPATAPAGYGGSGGGGGSDPWATNIVAGSYAAGTFGKLLQTNLDTNVGSRSTFATGGSVVATNIPAHFTNSTFSADGVLAATALVNTPAGSGGGTGDPWAISMTTANYASGTFGYTLLHNLDAAISSRSVFASGGTVIAANVPTHFTNTTFISDGVFAPAALANTPAGGGGGSTPDLLSLGTGVVVSVTTSPTYTVSFTGSNLTNRSGDYIGRFLYANAGSANPTYRTPFGATNHTISGTGDTAIHTMTFPAPFPQFTINDIVAVIG